MGTRTVWNTLLYKVYKSTKIQYVSPSRRFCCKANSETTTKTQRRTNIWFKTGGRMTMMYMFYDWAQTYMVGSLILPNLQNSLPGHKM